ncbi:hypothetical protein RRG08_017682 [Elysia crispata]|uniref:Uncharacterized protein n=1 Tax=Elysia crispata TaxID=231223 RepID=A0AAE1CYV7_9GAST|nr:hypothetical protein RRG08_017682 [Elysia crispata]
MALRVLLDTVGGTGLSRRNVTGANGHGPLTIRRPRFCPPSLPIFLDIIVPILPSLFSSSSSLQRRSKRRLKEGLTSEDSKCTLVVLSSVFGHQFTSPTGEVSRGQFSETYGVQRFLVMFWCDVLSGTVNSLESSGEDAA